MKSVEAVTSARLHLGFYNFLDDGVAYGSIGVAIDRPVARIVVRESNGLRVYNRSGIYMDDVVDKVSKALGVENVGITIYSAIPRHIGLGSTTQLSLALACAINKLYGLGYSVRELALKLGRGYVSGIGIAAFERGGFIVDTGRHVDKKGRLKELRNIADLPAILLRYSVPTDWRFVIIVPRGAHELKDNEEDNIISSPKQIDKEDQLLLYRELINGIIRGIVENDIIRFSKALRKIQRITGKYFSPYQQGIFCCRETQEIVEAFEKHRVIGVGQSSWGPLAYGLVRGTKKAKRILSAVLEDLKYRGVEVEAYYIAKPKNYGAVLKTI